MDGDWEKRASFAPPFDACMGCQELLAENKQLEQKNTALQKRCDALETGLQLFADRDHWIMADAPRGNRIIWVGGSPEPWGIARLALEKMEGELVQAWEAKGDG